MIQNSANSAKNKIHDRIFSPLWVHLTHIPAYATVTLEISMLNFEKKHLTIFILMCVLLISPNAVAGGGDLSNEAFESILFLIGVIGLAYVVAGVLSGWVERKWGLVIGAEYIILGAAIGPGFSILSPEVVAQISPAIVLAEGSLGLFAGLTVWKYRKLAGAFSIGSVISLFTFLVVTGIPMAVIYYWKGMEFLVSYFPHLLVPGTIAMIADTTPIRSLVDFLRAKGDGAPLIQSVAGVSTSMAIVVFGLIFCLFRPASELVSSLDLAVFESILFWLLIHVLIGIFLGLIFALFLNRDYSEEKLLTVGLGMIIFASGVAYFLKLSPIFVSFILGVVFSRISKQSHAVEKMLVSIERPAYISLYFFLGATLSFSFHWAALFVPFIYILLRYIGRGLGSIGARQAFSEAEPYPLMGPALWGPGALSAAMALNYFNVFKSSEYANEVYFILVLCILFSEPIAYKFVRRWLIDATDVELEKENSNILTREVA